MTREQARNIVENFERIVLSDDVEGRDLFRAELINILSDEEPSAVPLRANYDHPPELR